MDQRFEDSSEQSVDMAQEIPQEDLIHPGSEWVERKSGKIIEVLSLPRDWVHWDDDGIFGCPRKLFLELFKPAFLMDPSELFEQSVQAAQEVLQCQKVIAAGSYGDRYEATGRIESAEAWLEGCRRRYDEAVMAEARKRLGKS